MLLTFTLSTFIQFSHWSKRIQVILGVSFFGQIVYNSNWIINTYWIIYILNILRKRIFTYSKPPFIPHLKFGDGDGPNLCRVKKVDVSSTFIENIFRSGLNLVSSWDCFFTKIKNIKYIFIIYMREELYYLDNYLGSF